MEDEYIPSGIPGVDEMLVGKGFPRGHTILVSGGPGTGKTTFAMQFLNNGATKYGESGIYVTLDEDPEEIRKNMMKHGWDIEKLEDEKQLAFVNISPVKITPLESDSLLEIGMKEFRLMKLLEEIKKAVEEVNAKRIIVDPITIFSLQYPNEIERIYAMRDLIKGLKRIGCTNLLIAELRGTGIEREHQFEEYLAQGVILLRTTRSKNRLVRVFQVEKMRGLAIDNQPKPYEISSMGIEVYPDATIYE
jgi:circadian clock protein KaiC